MNRSTFAFIAVCIQQAACPFMCVGHAKADDTVLGRTTLYLEAVVIPRGPKLILGDGHSPRFDLDLNNDSRSAQVTVPVRVEQSNTEGTLSVTRPASSERLPELKLNLGERSPSILGLGGSVDLGEIKAARGSLGTSGAPVNALAPQARQPAESLDLVETLHISASYPHGSPLPNTARMSETLIVTFTANR